MPKSDNLIRAHSLLKESKAACSISGFDTVIGLLSQAAHAIPPSHPNLPECLDHLAAVLIARFSITQDLNDVRKAIGFRCGALGGDIRDLIEPNIIESSPNFPAPQELLSSAYQLLSQFRRSLDARKISTAIFFYEKVKAKQDITHPDRWNTQRALAEALLTRYRATGKKKDLHDGTMLLREQHLFESGYLATLCAAILMQPGLRPVGEVALLLEAAGPDDPVARSLAWEGLSNFLLANHVPRATCRRHSPREEEDEAVDDGVLVPSNMVQKLTGNRNQNLGDMALELEGQFKEHGQIRFLDEAIKLRRNALQSASRRAQDLHLDSLATTLQTRFEAVGDQKDIDEAVDLHRKALSIRVGTHHKRDISLLNFVNALLSRFDRLGNRKDIDEAIELLRKLVDMQPSPHLNRLGCLNNLAIALQTRFDNFGVVKDMMEATQMFRDVLAMHSLLDSDRADSLSNLASALQTRSKQSGDVEDMKEAVALHREALSITPVGHPDRGHALNKLASSILDQFRISGDSADIGESVKLHRKALALYSPDDPGYGSALDDLANALWTRYFQGNNPHDINESVDLHRQSLALYPHPHTSRGGRLHNLAVCLQTRYENLGDPHDMTEAIELHREALLLHAVPHPDRPKSLTNLANALKIRFDDTGDQNDIDESIRLYRESEKVKASASNGLANAILSRFEQWHDSQDIVEIIQIYRDGLARCPDPNPDRGSCLNRLANALCTSFRHGGDTRHLEEAITLHREAIAAYSPSHTNYGSALNDLAVALRTRFHKLHDFDDIEKVIELHRTALALRPIPHPARATSLSNLANALFDLHGDLEDIEEAISLHREALELHPAPYADRARRLNNLAHCLESAYIHHNDEKYLQQSMATFKEAATYSSAPPITRFSYATYWANIATKRPQTQTSALEAYQIAIDILPQLAALSLDVRSRHQILTTIASSAIGAGAANCAISLGNPGLAVEFLEASRSVFWTQALRLRTPLDDLRAINPKLASEFSQLSQDLEQASFRNNKFNNTGDVALLEAEGERCRHSNKQWERIVDSIRSINNFKDFMRPQGIATLQTTARLGPIVIIVLGESVAHTLIVKANETQSVALPLLTRERATYLVDLTRAVTSNSHFDLKQFNASCGDGGRETHRLFGAKEVLDSRPREDIFLDLLGALWNEIASPVISALELKKSTHPQRLWWCLTGPLIFLPIHAAGINLNNELEDCVSNYVISSYTPTLIALLNPPGEPLESFKMTTVIVPDAPNSSFLAGARTELAEIKRRVPEEWHTVVGETSMATVEATITALGNCSIAHFACHGVQDTVNPLNSGLVLSDGRLGITELMRRASVKDSNLSLAFLSACETAKGDNSTPDEAMHFAGVMLFAGFRSVIGTMWPMDDRDGPKIAATFYERLFGRFDATLQPRKFPDLAKSAEALHHAVNKLKEGKDAIHLRWVPFVHYGL